MFCFLTWFSLDFAVMSMHHGRIPDDTILGFQMKMSFPCWQSRPLNSVMDNLRWTNPGLLVSTYLSSVRVAVLEDHVLQNKCDQNQPHVVDIWG